MSVPDHEGRHGMWGAPYQPGYCILDGVRAALRSERTALSPSAPVLWGYSGGGWPPHGGRSMRLRARARHRRRGAGIAVGDLAHTFRRLNGGLLAGLPRW
ncbi:secretory lipase family protein [Mycobacterium xenopi 3993]|nr:secretory lipase family protein [Mycobacterium xenopi 3993]